MAIKGIVFVGSTVSTEFGADPDNSSSALLFVGHGRPGPEPLTDSDTVAPGGRSRTLSISAESEGLLRVFVDMASDNERGRLTVTTDGQQPPRWDEQVQGKTTWLFVVTQRPSEDE